MNSYRTFIRSKKGNIRYLFLALAALVLLPGSLWADPPASVKLAYADQKLQVEIQHPTLMPTKHYVTKVEIMLDGKLVSAASYSSQPAQQPIVYTYPLSAAPGARIMVRATCNMFGSKTATITLP